MWDEVSEIANAVREKEQEIEELRTQMEEDFTERYTLAEYQAVAGYESYTSSEPRNFFDKVNDGINRAEMSIQIKLPDDVKEKERRAASIGEQFLWGALAQIDRNFRGAEPPLREQLAFYACLRGWVALRSLVYQLGEETIFDTLVWDILHTTWEQGKNGLLWAANKRKMSKAQIKAEYDIDITGKDAELIDWFDTERNSIIIGSDFAKAPKEHKVGHCPVGIFSVGSMPTMQTKDFASTLLYRGHPVWAVSRNLYDPMNKLISRLLDRYERSVVGSIAHYSKDGKKALPGGGNPWLTYQEIKLSTDANESIEPLKLPDAPPETGALVSIMNKDIEQSTLPYPLAYGGTRQAMSGAALGILEQSTRSVYSPRTSVLEQAITWLCEEQLDQFNKQISTKTTMRGFTPDGKFFNIQVKPKEIDPGWYVVVSVQPKLPRDKQAEIFMALAATRPQGPGQLPLMSMQTAREEILRLRDPDAEQDKIYVEKGLSLEPILIANIAIALKEAGKPTEAEQILVLLKPPGAGAGAQPQLPPELVAAIVETLSMNPETAPLAQALMQAMGGPQGPVQGGPLRQEPPPVPAR